MLDYITLSFLRLTSYTSDFGPHFSSVQGFLYATFTDSYSVSLKTISSINQ
jgi:hypothetical protein